MAAYYRPWTGKIYIARYEMLNPHVVVDGTVALLTYNLVNYVRDEHAGESVGSCWNSTAGSISIVAWRGERSTRTGRSPPMRRFRT